MSRRARTAAAAEVEVSPDHPRLTDTMIAQPAAEAAFFAALAAGRAAGSWMLEGPAGVGKASLAYRIARRLLADGAAPAEAAPDAGAADLFGAPPDAPAAPAPPAGLDSDPEDPGVRKVRNASHPDLLVIDPDADGGRGDADLGVDHIRRIGPFLHLTPALGRWRVVIVDEADRMNRNAANALLKLLEEPPARSLILLAVGRPGALPPTVRSRCRRLKLAPVADDAVDGWLTTRRPALSAADRAVVVALAGGSPGRALRLADQDGARLWREIVSRLGEAPRLDWSAVEALAERLGGKAGDAAYRLWSELHLDALARLTRQAARPGGATEPALAPVAAAASLDRWIELWEKTAALRDRTRSANMDRKQAVLGAFALLEAATAAAGR